jgi:hypothetical protein
VPDLLLVRLTAYVTGKELPQACNLFGGKLPLGDDVENPRTLKHNERIFIVKEPGKVGPAYLRRKSRASEEQPRIICVQGERATQVGRACIQLVNVSPDEKRK